MATSTGQPIERPVDQTGEEAAWAGRLRRAAWSEVGAALLGMAAAGVAIVVYAWSAAPDGHILTVCGALALYAIAAVTVGTAVGFLFAIPRARSIPADGQAVSSEVSRFVPGSTVPNTNLEQISDWLTKVLVGASLVQLGNLGGGASQMFTAMAAGLGTGTSAEAVVGSVVVFGVGFGFIFGWLTTRTWIPRWLTASDRDVAALPAEKAGAGGDGGADARQRPAIPRPGEVAPPAPEDPPPNGRR